MLGFGRGSKVEVVLNGAPATYDAGKILGLIRKLAAAKEQREQLQANHDEMQRRLALANAKLKEYGHVSEF